jgi:iron complex outermembrane receptor protein
VLLDGHRMAADGEFQGVDVSVIPLSAVQRVDIVTDGASALYGSDAVAGVANFIMRTDYQGAELSQRVGVATDGGGLQQNYAGLAGGVWSGGHALASLEYLRQDPILARQRAITNAAPPGNPLIQAESQTALFVNLGQDLAPWASFQLDGLSADRRTGGASQQTLTGPLLVTHTAVQSYFVAPSLKFTLPAQWTARLDGVVSATRDSDAYIDPGSLSHFVNANSSDSVEASASGPALSLPSGPVKLAIGGGYRWETYLADQTPGARQSGERTVGFVYGEAFIPLVRPVPERAGLEALDLSLAGRAERYSDFGSTANPKVGLRYAPLEGLVIRGDWGTSFKAPQFVQTTFPGNIFYYPAAALGGRTGGALLTYGGNPDLKPERSRSWTLGVDWTPPAIPGLKVAATYFNIDFSGRIVQPISGVGTALANPVYAPFVVDHPTAVQQAAAIAAAARFYNFVGGAYDATSVVALVNDLFVNASAQAIDGIDLSVKQRFTLGGDAIDAVFDGSWLRIRQRTLPTAPTNTLTGTLFNPPTLRLRSGVTWTHGDFAATAMVNYVSGETDTGVSPNVPIAPWTTIDLTLHYTVSRASRLLPNLDIGLSVANLLDQAPPYARGAAVQAPGFNFDSTNASPIGRFVALTLRERF